MVWQRIDDGFGVSKKVIRIPRARRFQCIGLWTLAGNYAVRALTDGVLEAHELDELGANMKDVAELVRVGMWHGHGHDCDRCVPVIEGDYVIHDHLEYNPSRAQVEADREAERVRKAAQRANRKKGSPDGSPTGTTEGTPAGTPGGSGAASEVPVPSRPVPAPLTTDIPVSPVPDREGYPQGTDEEESDEELCARQLTFVNVDYAKVKTAIGTYCGRVPQPTQVVQIATTILGRAVLPIDSPTGLVLAAVKNDWAEWQKFMDGRSAA